MIDSASVLEETEYSSGAVTVSVHITVPVREETATTTATDEEIIAAMMGEEITVS